MNTKQVGTVGAGGLSMVLALVLGLWSIEDVESARREPGTRDAGIAAGFPGFASRFEGAEEREGRGEEERPPKPSDLGFLVGRWEGEMGGGRFAATYTPAGDDRLIGHSELWKEGKVRFFEFEVFRLLEGKLTLQPYPSGRPVTGFMELKVDWAERRVTCDNPNKDWPTRIVYHRVAEDRLVITLSEPGKATSGDAGKVEVYDLKRVE